MPEETLKKYKIIGQIEIYNPEGEPTGEFLEEGSIQTVPEELGSSWVDAGLAEEYTEIVDESTEIQGDTPEDVPNPISGEKEDCKNCNATGLESPTKLCEKCKGFGEVSSEE